MKTVAAVPLLLALCCLNPLARADDESDRAALRAIKAHYEEAANSGDLSKIQGDLSKDVTGIMVTSDTVQGYEGLVNYWKHIQDVIGPGGTYHVTVNVDKTDIIGEVAVSRGTTDEKITLANGKEISFTGGWTSVCRKEDGAWKVFRIQETMNPINNAFVALRSVKTKVKYGGAGLVAGLALMLAVHLVLRKRRA
ncbi:MAG TPA: nuclear transport factor 2 family protein [Chthoniobacteraceae bacterium]|nr:nuclear transport factor 2 family protein [Chthoniobacteraceae bacterium]